MKDLFDKLLKASDILSPSVTKLLQKAGLPVGNRDIYKKKRKSAVNMHVFDFIYHVEEQELLRLTNPDSIQVESSYQGPRKYLFSRRIVQEDILFYRCRWANNETNIHRFNRSISTRPNK